MTQRFMLREGIHLLTAKEAAQILRQHPSTIRRKARSGEIPSLKIGPGERAPIRFDSRELDAFIHNPRGAHA
jgi:excisionase family DNA binding protein